MRPVDKRTSQVTGICPQSASCAGKLNLALVGKLCGIAQGVQNILAFKAGEIGQQLVNGLPGSDLSNDHAHGDARARMQALPPMTPGWRVVRSNCPMLPSRSASVPCYEACCKMLKLDLFLRKALLAFAVLMGLGKI